MKFLIICLFAMVSCNEVSDKGEQGYRENQEQATTPHDYTDGKDATHQPKTNRP